MTATTIDPFAAGHRAGPIRFLYRLNPLAKVVATLPAMVILLFSRDVWTPLAFLLLSLLLLAVGAALPARWWLAILGCGAAAITVLTISFGIWSAGSLQVGLATALRLCSLVGLALLSGLTTTGVELVRSMVQQLRMPYRVGYTALAAFRFVPRFRYELDVIRAAHRIRGMAGGRGPIAGIRRYLGYVVPLLASAIRHAERVALAMDSRGFGAHPTRTERHLIPVRVRDAVFAGAFWIATALILIATPALST